MATSGTADASAPAKPLSLKIGEAAKYSGLTVTVTAAKPGPKDFAGKATYMVSVSYKNAGTEAASFNEMDWKLEDAGGARSQDTAILSSSPKTLGFGEIAPGGSKSGTMYFGVSTKTVKVIYEPSFLSSEENLAAWNVK
jgi:hypothetical protein